MYLISLILIKKIENIIKEYKESKVSHAAYKSLIDGCDVCFDIKPVSMQQSIILENKNVGQNKISFYVETNDLTACLCEDRSITFNNLDGDIIFIIPSPIMHDSGSDMIYHGNVDVSLVNYENGYIISYIPDREWILSEDRNYPVRISQGVYLYNNIYTYTLSMDYPNAYINNDTLEIGGNLAHKYDALITIPYNNILSSDYFTITDAKLYLYFNSCDNPDYQRPLRISALLGSYMPWWSGVPFDYVKELNRFEVSLSCYNDIDVTSIINSWKNYYCSSGNVGVYPYGLIIDSFYGFCSVYQADAASGTHAPFYAITYFADSNYNFTFSPTKYDDNVDTDDNNTNNDIYNFQKRMNCYSYALQIYDHSYVNGNNPHNLMPGELSLSINPQFSTVSQLFTHYHSIDNNNEFINFTESQMIFDSIFMGTNLQKINLVNEEQFVLPNGYNENSQRIIAMNTGTSSPTNSRDFHFYVRHGNGSCSIHGGNCSIWSHKRSNLCVSSTIPKVINGQTQEIPICDYNIASLAYCANFPSVSGSGGNFYNTRPRFYIIQQDLNVYNEWYTYNNLNDITMYVY